MRSVEQSFWFIGSELPVKWGIENFRSAKLKWTIVIIILTHSNPFAISSSCPFFSIQHWKNLPSNPSACFSRVLSGQIGIDIGMSTFSACPHPLNLTLGVAQRSHSSDGSTNNCFKEVMTRRRWACCWTHVKLWQWRLSDTMTFPSFGASHKTLMAFDMPLLSAELWIQWRATCFLGPRL